MESLGFDPVSAAKQRIDACERYGMEVDPADVTLVARAERRSCFSCKSRGKEWSGMCDTCLAAK
jgi:hypothetical protein